MQSFLKAVKLLGKGEEVVEARGGKGNLQLSEWYKNNNKINYHSAQDMLSVIFIINVPNNSGIFSI